MTNAEKFFEKIKDKKVAFIGIGVSHTDVIRQFAEKGIYTEARDKTDREKLGETAELLEKSGAVLKLGEGLPWPDRRQRYAGLPGYENGGDFPLCRCVPLG